MKYRITGIDEASENGDWGCELEGYIEDGHIFITGQKLFKPKKAVEMTDSIGFSLKFTQEGHMFCCYLIKNETLENVRLLGSIAIGAVGNNPERLQAFKELMMGFVQEMCMDLTGKKFSFVDVLGPD